MRRILLTAFGIAVLSSAVLGTPGCGSDPQSEFDGGGPGDGGTDTGAGGGDDGSSGFVFSDAGSADTGGPACATTSQKAEQAPLDMVIGLDTSFSMDFDAKWTNVKSAMEAFVSNPAYADLGIGLQFFPIRKQCSVPEYQALAVGLDLQPVVAGPITVALEAQQMAGGTPMVPMLQGLTAYLRANAKPKRKPVIVLATDGIPDDTCVSPVGGETPNTLDNAIAVAAAALAGTPPIPIFVIGVGKELSALNGIAAAGGTTQATLVDTGGNAQQAFLAALAAARKQSISCDFAIPAGSTIDPSKTNVNYTPAGGGTPVQFVYVGDASSCSMAPQNGWYFDDPVSPKKVILCSGACDIVKADDRAEVDVVFGCPRVGVR